ncbi:hypothetical protein LTR97_005952 [Elasticomyces elasticus]|uniref:Nucleoporin Pom152 n=1 Tax=Elasticomyces elasticus TaxID=574655 RepID=A0AAN7W5V8_9PEZI|nr:hypothetical protein LTR97_005952 [Elasticomyces elasticus]
MDGGTPRLRSAFPATPQTNRQSGRLSASGRVQRVSERLPEIPVLQASTYTSSPGEPWIPEHVVDAPTQRLMAVVVWVALSCWKAYDFSTLQDTEEHGLWLFMKWVVLDGLFLFLLPTLQIPWLEWTPFTTVMLFSAHAITDGMLMFRIPIPIAAGFAALGRSLWGAYEMAINERNVNPRTVTFNESLILGRQIIHILPEGSAILNPERHSFCVDGSGTEIKLPITINATNPISMDIVRMDLESNTNETLHISKSQLKAMHKEASRLVSYGQHLHEPKTLYYTVKKSGLYALAKVVDESNLEVTRKKMAHTVVVRCPKANVLPTTSDRCKGEMSNVDLEVIGTPPMRVKYRKVVNLQPMEATFESIQPEDFTSPLVNADRQLALTIPNKVDTAWARSQKVRVPLTEGLATAGKWVFSVVEVEDGFGNKVTYSDRDHENQDKHSAKSAPLHQIVTVHERPTISLHGCTPQQPLKVAKGSSAHLPVQLGSTGRGAIPAISYHIDYLFSPSDGISATGEHSSSAQSKRDTIKESSEKPSIKDAGLYTITGVSTDHCRGEVLEPASCLLQNPQEPGLKISHEEIFDKCAGSPIGLRVDLDLVGTPPFDVKYRMYRKGERSHTDDFERVNGHRGQISFTPKTAGDYQYDFMEISDAVYKDRPIKDLKLTQTVKPAASAAFIGKKDKRVSCIDEAASYDVLLQGDRPFTVEYELVHGSKRAKYTLNDLTEEHLVINTPPLRDGGEYTLALVSITDKMQCKEFLRDEVKISVRHQKPRVAFGQLEGDRRLNTLEGKKVELPLRLAGEAPWTVTYVQEGKQPQTISAQHPNDKIVTSEAGRYKLLHVKDSHCPGQVDETADWFEVDWIPRPDLRIAPSEVADRKGDVLTKADVCEGDDDGVEILFKGSPPYTIQYVEHVKPEHGAVAPKNREVRAAVNFVNVRMDTVQAGTYEYKFNKLEDANYQHSPKHFTPLTLQQRVHARPSVAFATPGKTYSYCSVESDGEEVIPITLHGAPPFDVEYEIKHHGTGRPETLSLTGIVGNTHNIRIPHSRVHLGKSAVSLRRVSDSRGCSRIIDSTTPRVQIAVFDAPTISPLQSGEEVCVGEHIEFALSGVAPFTVYYEFAGQQRKAQATGTTFRRLAEKPGTFTMSGVTDSASQCKASTNIVRHIHGMPSVRVSHGRENYVDIHEGGEADILFEFGGVPPFEFSYTRSSNTDKGGKRGTVLDMRHEVSEGHSLRIKATEEGTYEVVSIRDRYCAYAKPGVKTDWKQAKKMIMLAPRFEL